MSTTVRYSKSCTTGVVRTTKTDAKKKPAKKAKKAAPKKKPAAPKKARRKPAKRRSHGLPGRR